MSWYKQSKVEDGVYVLDPDGRLHPCHSHDPKDCLAYVADQYNVLTKDLDRGSEKYFNEILENGFAIISVGREINITKSKELNLTQQATVNALNKNRR